MRALKAFKVDVWVAKPARRPRWIRIPQVIVDSGSGATWLPASHLRAAGIEVFKQSQVFGVPGGRHVTRDVGIALIRAGDFKTVDEVVFAARGDLRLLGGRTLDGFNAVVDTKWRKLVSAGPIPAG